MKRWASPTAGTEDSGGEFKDHDYEELSSPPRPEYMYVLTTTLLIYSITLAAMTPLLFS